MGSLYVEDLITFYGLDLYDGAGPGQDLSIEDASTNFGGFPDFSSPNTLDFGAVVVGPVASASRIGRIQIDVPLDSRRVDARLYVFPGPTAGNRIFMHAFDGGIPVGSVFFDIPSGSSYIQVDLQVVANRIDSLRIEGVGSNLDGTFIGFIDQVVVLKSAAGTSYCFGDGSGAACPCANFDASGLGCRNSTGIGSYLVGYGSSGLTANNLDLVAGQLPPGVPCLLIAASGPWASGAGTAFGDGLRCIGSPVQRLGIRSADSAGQATWGDGFFATSGAQPGASHYFQVWYRDPSGPCGNQFNLTSGIRIDATL